MERTHTIPLGDTYYAAKTRRANVAIKKIRGYIEKRLKLSNVKIDPKINEAVWGRSIRKPPRTIRIKISEEEDKKTAVLAE